jgi:hypothetical protein
MKRRKKRPKVLTTLGQSGTKNRDLTTPIIPDFVRPCKIETIVKDDRHVIGWHPWQLGDHLVCRLPQFKGCGTRFGLVASVTSSGELTNIRPCPSERWIAMRDRLQARGARKRRDIKVVFDATALRQALGANDG